MASATGDGVAFWMDLSLFEMIQWMQGALEVQKEEEQARAGMEVN